MKTTRFVVAATITFIVAALGYGQTITGGSDQSGNGTSIAMGGPSAPGGGTMMSGPSAAAGPAAGDGAGSMMSGTNAASGTSNSMMSANPMTADPVVGSQLRFAMSTGTKLIYSSLEATEQRAGDGPTVLFFAADWCPYCQADLRDINANGSRLGNITIVVADYDKVAALKTKYGVTVQDTFVQIDAQGKELAIWNGGGVDGILQHVVHA